MKINISSLANDLDSMWKITETILKFGMLAGGICVTGYSLRIDYFPKDLSVADGILFLIAAACFGILYIAFVASLIELGIFLSPVVIRLMLFIRRIQNKPLQFAYEPAPFSWWSALFSLFSVLIIIGFGQHDFFAFIMLPLLAIGLYLFYSVYRSSGNTMKKIEEANSSIVHSNEKEATSKLANPATLKDARLLSLGMILFIPLFLTGTFGQLLDGAMRLAHVRIENAVVFTKEPYSSLFPEAAREKNQNPPKEYAAYGNITILFKGFGKNTVISFKDGNTVRQIEIPNDHVIIQKR